MFDYKNKYIKYKNKYLKLKFKLIGAGDLFKIIYGQRMNKKELLEDTKEYIIDLLKEKQIFIKTNLGTIISTDIQGQHDFIESFAKPWVKEKWKYPHLSNDNIDENELVITTRKNAGVEEARKITINENQYQNGNQNDD